MKVKIMMMMIMPMMPILEDGVGHAERMRCDEKFIFCASANGW